MNDIEVMQPEIRADVESKAMAQSARSIVSRWVTEHGDAMLRWATRLLGDRYEAEDAVQDALVVALRRVDTVRDGSERAWLLGVTHRVCLSKRRRRWLSIFLPDDLAIEQAAPIESDQRSRTISRCLDRLPDRQRELLYLVFSEGQTVEQSAEILGISLGTARTHYHRAKQSMREFLAQEGIEDAKGEG
jgi:RNA polymerase sigma-70 factor (ECF subfamily)